ncbi:hypothetical protein UA08_00618 [Talaromyces atroroseus]|uniref:Zn(2)-C6 fungal-type domain-containing protein n=1 Tax=Talaromyces atroroseus TaxID=1441469 RepID=A0A225AZN7_TALAT|nr:hypothetical protein UA08_00618 [Talaromyces atroroseus]OKL63914.1 hypothetical protein UA08_00618 [Talaromyces atroroseus]
MSSSSAVTSKPPRVLACVLCQQRKVKCDRSFPCANCVRSRAQCVPATLSRRRRRRRFPERELLDRLRMYEDLLRQNSISFEPLHKDSPGDIKSNDARSDYDSEAHDAETAVPQPTLKRNERRYKQRSQFRDPENDSDSSHDEVREAAVKTAWDHTVPKDDNLLFGTRDTTVELSTLHPDPVQIFRLWQVYLDNVNPLLKVTHTPTLQARIIEAVSNLAGINHTLEALMFSIYCMSITSLNTEDCQSMFGSSKEELLARYQFGCQQALYNCGFLRSSDRECLTALYFYLLSVVPNTVPQSLYSMLGVAIRTAQRMGIQNESALAKHPVIEAEMRRRLWWSLVLFDYRLSEITTSHITTLDPTWDCKVPLNVNDSDLRPDMKEPPAIQGVSTEALFAVLRSELGEYIRHTLAHLNFTNPALKSLASISQNGSASEGGEMDQLERIIENRYLKFCDPENPLHYMTIWTMRAYIAKSRLFEHHVKYYNSSVSQTDAQRDSATSLALRMLESDTKIMTSPITKGFRWINRLYFPFPAYLQIAQDLRMRPASKQVSLAWEVLSDSYDAWFESQSTDIGPIYEIYARVILQAWEACEEASKLSGVTSTPPRIVTYIRRTLSGGPKHAPDDSTDYTNSDMDIAADNPPMPMPANFPDLSLLYRNRVQNSFAAMRPEIYPVMFQQAPLDGHTDQLDWTAFLGQPNWLGF